MAMPNKWHDRIFSLSPDYRFTTNKSIYDTNESRHEYFIQMAVYYFIITNVSYGTTTSDTTCTRINNDCSG